VQPTSAVNRTNATTYDEVREFLESVTSVEGRLAVSVGLLILTLVVGVVVAPWVVRYVNRVVNNRLVTGRYASAAEVVGEYVPTTLSDVLLRAIQLTLFIAVLVLLLVVWGLIDLAVAVVTFVGVSIPFLFQLATTLALVLSAYIAADLLEQAVSRFSEGADRVTEHQEEIILRMGHLGILALAVAGGLTVWGVNLSGLIVGAGFLGIVVGLAARQTLGSLIAGFVLMFSRPFTIGDWVAIGDQEGIVTDITIFNTRLENFDGEFVVIPNDIVGNQPITNRSRKGHLRIRQDVGIDYDVDTDHAHDVAIDAMNDVDAIEQTPPPQVIPKEFGDSSVVLELRFWIDRPTPPRKWQATSAVVRAVKAAFDDEDIKIPFPQRELSGRPEAGGLRVGAQNREVDARQQSDGEQRTPRPADSVSDGQAGDGQADTDGESVTTADSGSADDSDS